jgi:hypothetical protein
LSGIIVIATGGVVLGRLFGERSLRKIADQRFRTVMAAPFYPRFPRCRTNAASVSRLT